ncbi:hypothetical protein LTR53_001129 [Teratosphaeriaceae sp. CCFEE 6253]|nr:hypothetical protein LTR53_001129 [Teratosphaeriaceae sp. CCFEE 6253]
MGSITQTPFTRLQRLSFVIYEHPDLGAFRSFAQDFGFEEVSSTADEYFFAGYGRDPFVYTARRAPSGAGKRFVGAGFCAETEAEFKKACAHPGAEQVNTVGRPGSGQAVSIRDNNGFVVEVCWGQEEKELPEHGISSVVDGRPVVNGALDKARQGESTRIKSGPAAVHKLGHFGYITDQYEATWDWYTKTFNFVATDILWAPGHKESDVATFFRLDLGKEYVDHHCLLITRAEKPGSTPATTVHHSSFEVEDLDTQMMGHQHLLNAGHELVWGIGRHVHGSQVFDYWYDPSHFIIEHYADGDVVNEECKTTKFEAGNMAVWGPPVPVIWGGKAPVAKVTA